MAESCAAVVVSDESEFIAVFRTEERVLIITALISIWRRNKKPKSIGFAKVNYVY